MLSLFLNLAAITVLVVLMFVSLMFVVLIGLTALTVQVGDYQKSRKKHLAPKA